MTDGFLSQTIEKIEDHKEDLEEITGLPEEAVEIRKKAVTLLGDNISSRTSTQNELQESSVGILEGLQKALLSIQENKTETLELIDATYKIALKSQEKLEIELAQNANLKEAILNLSHSLTDILRTFQNRSAELMVEEQKAKDRANKFKKRRFYFLSLGPFGLAGLSTATALFTTWSTKAKKATRAASKVRNQIKAISTFKENINTLQKSFGSGVEVLSGAKNALSFLSGDIRNVIQNTYASTEDTIVLSLFLNAAIAEVNMLIVDVS